MKTIQIAITAMILIFAAQPAIAQNKTAGKSGMRFWTEKATGEKIMAEIISKDPDGRRIRLKLKNGKKIWLESSRLSVNDQNHAKNWTYSRVSMKAKTLSSGANRSSRTEGWSITIQSTGTNSDSSTGVSRTTENKTKKTSREIGITFNNGGLNEDFLLEVYWLGFHKNEKNNRKIYATTARHINIPMKEVISVRVSALYNFRERIKKQTGSLTTREAWGSTYAGWLVRLSDSSGNLVAKQASQTALVKYLDTIPLHLPKEAAGVAARKPKEAGAGVAAKQPVYITKIDEDKDDILKLDNGAIVKITRGLLGLVGLRKDAVLYKDGGRWKIWIEGKKAFDCDVLKAPPLRPRSSGVVISISEVKGEGAILTTLRGSTYEVGDIHVFKTSLWLGNFEALLIDGNRLLNLEEGSEIIDVTKLK